MPGIEVEIRSFISEEKYNELIAYFKSSATHVKEDYQETHYLDAPVDLRIQKNNFFSKIWMKKGRLHDECREEIEIKFPLGDFEKIAAVFSSIGFFPRIKWFRNRNEFDWNGIKVCIDYTKGYGYIIEMEKMAGEDDKQEALAMLKEQMAEFGIQPTSREEFESKFRYYEENWKTLTESE